MCHDHPYTLSTTVILVIPASVCSIDLCVGEEEHDWEVLEPGLQQTVLHILSPLSYTVVLGELYLETVVVRPAMIGWNDVTKVYMYMVYM